MDLKLHSYWRSSAAFRVRIALNLKQLQHEIIPLDLVKNGDELRKSSYTQKNPQQLIPVLQDGDNVLRQSLAIIEYLDEVQPLPPLLPTSPIDRAWVRALAMDISCDLHPLNNFRVMKYLHKQLKLSDEEKNGWYGHWLTHGLVGIESTLKQSSKSGLFCLGDQVTLADICLIPQLFNAKGFGHDLSAYPLIHKIFQECMKLPAFQNASWESQSDYPK